MCTEKMLGCFAFMNCEYREGRPDSAPMVKRDEQILREDVAWQHDDDARNVDNTDDLEQRLHEDDHGTDRVRWGDLEADDVISDDMLACWSGRSTSTSTS